MTPEAVAVLKPHCRVVARQGVGIDNLNAELLRREGILAFNVPDYCAGEVSDHTMAMVLALERNLCAQDSRLKAGSWNVYAGGYPRRLSGLTFGIIGFGRIGRATARKAQAFYGSVIAYDPFVHADLLACYGVGTRQHLSELLEESDVVVLHAWLDEQSRHVINRESVRHVRPGAILVNTARGDLVEPEAVLAALEGGRLAGYGSDVFAPEDPNEHPVNRRILAFENVVATSHRAFLSRESERSLRIRVAEEIMYVLTTGQPPRFGRVA
jgi:phosphoglycerate dehydrogenase-like enzyme